MNPTLRNPALAELEFLLGDWDMTLSNASFLPGPDQTVAGRVEFQPLEDGNLLVMRQSGGPSTPPLASWVIGRDAAKPGYTVLYTDERGVSRAYEMSVVGNTWAIWRDDPDFSQRFEATISGDRNSIAGQWDKCPATGAWEHDFDVVYSRPPSASD
jgi:hypothetical protein